MINDPRGSIWRKWDLHVHTPASFHWQGNHFSTLVHEDDALLKQMVTAMNSTDVDAFGIMDYWTFDGWFALRAYLVRNPGILLNKVVFPGIELRLEAPTDFRLNTHFLFDNTLTDQQLGDFLTTLKVGLINRSPSREAFIQLAREYDNGKLAHHGYRVADRDDESKMVKLGMETAKITRDSWRNARHMLGDQSLLLQPYDTSDGMEHLDWKRHPYDDTELMRAADLFETRNPIHVRLFVGAGHPTKPAVSEDFRRALGNRWCPVVSGSDAHRFADYGVFPDGKTSWLKADLTFAGLRQCKVDPIGRVFIGNEPAKVRHVQDNLTKYISSIRIRKVPGSQFQERWFDCDILMNPGMIAIIGNKGGGKSALADILALAGNSHCPNFEFLNEKRFRKPADNKAQHYEATLTWSNGEEVSVFLSDDPNIEQPERVRYLPQQYLEQLCTDVGSEGRTSFEIELRKVVFSHVPVPRRLGYQTLDELVQNRTDQLERHAGSLRIRLSVLNREIAALERELRPENLATISAQIALKEQELAAWDTRCPIPITPPNEHDGGPEEALVQKINECRTNVETLRANSEIIRGEYTKNAAAAGAAERLGQRLNNLEADVQRAIEDASEDAAMVGIDLTEIISFQLDTRPVLNRQRELTDSVQELARRSETLERENHERMEELERLQEEVSAPQRIYQHFLEDQQIWEIRRQELIGTDELPGTLEFLRARLRMLQTDVPGRLDSLRRDRLGLVAKLYEQIQQQLEVFRELYAPIALAAERHQFVRQHLGLGFNVLVDGTSFADRLLSMLNLGRRGTFYGQLEGGEAARKLMRRANLADLDGLILFLEDVMSAMTIDRREGRGERIEIDSQLRDGFDVENVYDFVFGLSYLRPRLTLQLAGKEVEELSPGERGILLLVFYLLLDREEIPLIIDQPEHNLDNASVYALLEPCIRRAKNRRQIVLVTHSPNVAIVCDAEQVIVAEIDKRDGYHVTYRCGAIENPALNLDVVNVLEGTWPAFDTRDAAYQRPSAFVGTS